MTMLLVAVLLLPLLGAIVVATMPREQEQGARNMGLFFSVVTFCVSLGIVAMFDGSSGAMQLEVIYPWIASFGINIHLGVDGISLWLVMLTTFLTPIVILSTYKAVQDKVKELVITLLLLQVGMLGAFMALDLFLFYVFWELMLVPMFLIIGIWGHGQKIYAANKFVLYTMVGSLPMLVAIIYMYVTHGQATGDYTFDFMILNQVIWDQQTQVWLFAAFALAFAIKVPMFPLHTWLPDAHTQAPTAGSVILAGVLLKLGTYGFIRFAIPLFPWGAAYFAPVISTLAVVGIAYGALVAYAQSDAKRLVAYSSVSHLGFVMLGMMSMTVTGLQGSIYQMLSHGVSTGGLFLAIGMLYERRHTHELAAFGGIWRKMPIFGGVFMVTMLSSAGLPGLNGFVGEFLILVGSFIHTQYAEQHRMPLFIRLPWGTAIGSRVMAAFAATGLVLGAVYLLHMFQKLMFGPIKNAKNAVLKDMTPREIWCFVPLIVLMFWMGMYPKPFLERMEPAVRSFQTDYRAKFDASEKYVEGPPIKLPALRARLSGAPPRSAVTPPRRGRMRPQPRREPTGRMRRGR